MTYTKFPQDRQEGVDGLENPSPLSTKSTGTIRVPTEAAWSLSDDQFHALLWIVRLQTRGEIVDVTEVSTRFGVPQAEITDWIGLFYERGYLEGEL